MLLGKYLLPMYRDRIVLANKVHDRTAAGAQRQLEQSLANLKTDKIDILHFHDLTSIDDVSRIMARGGAYETLARAKAQGITASSASPDTPAAPSWWTPSGGSSRIW